ncbi:MAG TPA: hypothetical protein VFM97_09595 [Gammaproteobacteria bacterium]|nr:hypothetical protein [Gammaproteobacteria bacterium]
MQHIICPHCQAPTPLYADAKTAAATKVAAYPQTDMLLQTYTGRYLRPRVKWTDTKGLVAAREAGDRGRLKITMAEAASETGDVLRDVKDRQTIYFGEAVKDVAAPDLAVTSDGLPALTITGALEAQLDEEVERIERAALCRDLLARKFAGATIAPPAPTCASCGEALPLLLNDTTATTADLGERDIAVKTAAGYDLVTTVEQTDAHPFTNAADAGDSIISYRLATRSGDLKFQPEPHSFLVGGWRPHRGIPRPSIQSWAAGMLEEHLTAAEAYVMLHEERP